MGHDQGNAAGNELCQEADCGSFCRHVQSPLLLHMTVEDIRVGLIDFQKAYEKYYDKFIPAIVTEFQSIKTVSRAGDDHRPAGNEPHAVIFGKGVLLIDVGRLEPPKPVLSDEEHQRGDCEGDRIDPCVIDSVGPLDHQKDHRKKRGRKA